jgi:hypothetical protein
MSQYRIDECGRLVIGYTIEGDTRAMELDLSIAYAYFKDMKYRLYTKERIFYLMFDKGK